MYFSMVKEKMVLIKFSSDKDVLSLVIFRDVKPRGCFVVEKVLHKIIEKNWDYWDQTLVEKRYIFINNTCVEEIRTKENVPQNIILF